MTAQPTFRLAKQVWRWIAATSGGWAYESTNTHRRRLSNKWPGTLVLLVTFFFGDWTPVPSIADAATFVLRATAWADIGRSHRQRKKPIPISPHSSWHHARHRPNCAFSLRAERSRHWTAPRRRTALSNENVAPRARFSPSDRSSPPSSVVASLVPVPGAGFPGAAEPTA
jgi:hypothetical protein